MADNPPREQLSTASIIYVFLFLIVGLPVVIYCAYQLKASWSEQWLILRQRTITATVYITCAIILLLHLLYALRDLFPSPLSQVHTQIGGAIDQFLSSSLLLLFVTRAWLLQLSLYNFIPITFSIHIS